MYQPPEEKQRLNNVRRARPEYYKRYVYTPKRIAAYDQDRDTRKRYPQHRTACA